MSKNNSLGASAKADQALVASDGAQEVSTLTGFDPSREWGRLYAALLSMEPDGKFADQDAAFDLILAGFIESREVKKPCRNCGTPLLDYRYNRITGAGRLFMEVAAIAMEARQGLDPKGLDGEAATARDSSEAAPEPSGPRDPDNG